MNTILDKALRALALAALVTTPLACGDDASESGEPKTDVVPVDTAATDSAPGDASIDTTDLEDTGDGAPDATSPPDVAPVDDVQPTDAADATIGPTAAPLSVGVGRVRMPVPLGIGTAGFGQLSFGGGGGGAKSRYADAYPASTRIYTHPTLHAVALKAGDTTLVMLRADLVGITQQARQAVVKRVIERGGPDLQHGLVAAATHTHSGPGRLVDIELWSAITDSFFPEFYVRMIESMSDAVLAAIADLEPARFGATEIDTDALHGDRRCENPEHLNGSMPILRFDRKSDGKTKAVVAMYSVHGTVIDSKVGALTRDFHGAVELKLEERFDSPVTALFFNSWSGDTSPKADAVESALPIPSDFNALEAAGNRGADLIEAALADVTLTDEVVLDAHVARIPLSLDALGYAEDEFPWEHGAVYCGGGIEPACFGQGAPPEPFQLTGGCVPFSATSPAPEDTLIGLIRIGDRVIATMPGEPLTALGERVVEGIEAGAKDVLGTDLHVHLLGYAQDYVGYDVPEEDWYRGGYEASGALWGPKQGDYLADRTIEWAVHTLTGGPLDWEPMPPHTPKNYAVAAWTLDTTAPATIAVDAKPSYVTGEVVELVVNAGDPWLLAPTVTLMQEAPGGWIPVLKKNGRPVDSSGYEFELALEVTPPYGASESPTERTFAWTVRFPTRREAATTNPALGPGKYALRIVGKTSYDKDFELTSNAFVVGAPL